MKAEVQATVTNETQTKLILRNAELTILILAMLISTAGTHLLLVALAVDYLKTTGSTLVAGFVYAAQLLAPVALTRLAARTCSNNSPRRVVVICEFVGFASALIVALLWNIFWITFLVLALRGYLDILVKSSRAVALKIYLQPKEIERGNTLANASLLLGALLGGLIGSVVIEYLSVTHVACINAATYAISALIYRRLPASTVANKYHTLPKILPTAKAAFATDPSLGRAFAYLVTVCTLFQGVHQTARIYIPMRDLGLGGAGVSMLQAAAFAGVLIGLAIAGKFLAGRSGALRLLPALTFGAAAAGLIAPLSSNPEVAFSGYFVFMLLFELAFVVSMNAVVSRSPIEALPVLMVLFYACSFGGMAAMTLLSGVGMDRYGSTKVFFLVGSTAMACVLLIEIKDRRRSNLNY